MLEWISLVTWVIQEIGLSRNTSLCVTPIPEEWFFQPPSSFSIQTYLDFEPNPVHSAHFHFLQANEFNTLFSYQPLNPSTFPFPMYPFDIVRQNNHGSTTDVPSAPCPYASLKWSLSLYSKVKNLWTTKASHPYMMLPLPYQTPTDLSLHDSCHSSTTPQMYDIGL